MKTTIPIDESDITRDWLRTALDGQGFKAFAAVSTEKPPAHGAMSVVRKINIQYNDDSETGRAPPSLIAKFATKKTDNAYIAPLMRDNGLYRRELRVYSQLKQDHVTLVPEIFYEDYNEETGDFIIIMEDLSLRGVVVDQRMKTTFENASKVIRAIAQFHAKYWHEPNENFQSTLQGTNDPYMIQHGFEWLPSSFSFLYLTRLMGTTQEEFAHYTQNNVQNLLTNFDKGFTALTAVVNVLAKNNDSKYEKMVQQVAKIAQDKENIMKQYEKSLKNVCEVFPRTIVHGDFRSENMAVMNDDQDCEIKVVDWQCTSVGCGLWDVSTYIVQCLDPELRHEWETQLLELYCDSLNKSLGEGRKVSLDDIKMYYNSCKWFELNFVASTIGPAWKNHVDQGKDLTSAGRLFEVGVTIISRVSSAICEMYET